MRLSVDADAERFVETKLPPSGLVRVLAAEAGEQRFEIRAPAHVVSADVIQAERGFRGDADEQRTLDLEYLELESETYDVVLCINVLEHVHHPLDVFPIVRQSLTEGGLFVLMLPNVSSVKGMVTRLTPARFHRWFYARILKSPPGHAPVASVHSFSLRPSSLLGQARAGGWTLEYFRLYEGPTQMALRTRIGLVGGRWRIVTALTRSISFGTLTARDTGIVAVLSKPADGVRVSPAARPGRTRG